SLLIIISSFFFNHPPTTRFYTLSLHDALPISEPSRDLPHFGEAIGVNHEDGNSKPVELRDGLLAIAGVGGDDEVGPQRDDRHAEIGRAQRLNSSHVAISYAGFCLKKKTARGEV